MVSTKCGLKSWIDPMNTTNVVKDRSDQLKFLSMLPAGANHPHLDWWAPTLKNRARAIATLSDAALIVDRDLGESRGTMISVIPVVQSYMQ